MLKIRKRLLHTENGHFLLSGVKLKHLEKMPPGAVVFDPQVVLPQSGQGYDTYIYYKNSYFSIRQLQLWHSGYPAPVSHRLSQLSYPACFTTIRPCLEHSRLARRSPTPLWSSIVILSTRARARMQAAARSFPPISMCTRCGCRGTRARKHQTTKRFLLTLYSRFSPRSHQGHKVGLCISAIFICFFFVCLCVALCLGG